MKISEYELKKVGMKPILPLKPGHVVPATNDKVFKNLANDKHNRKFLAKIISLSTGIDYDFLVENMYLADTNTGEGTVFEHHNEQDIIVSLDNMRINLEMSMNNKSENIRKNQITAFKYASNIFKVGEGYNKVHIFYQINIENYNTFNNDLLITEVNLVDVSSGKYEKFTDEYKQFHVNLNNVSKGCYNNLDEKDKYFKFFLLDEIKELEELAGKDEIMEDAVNKLKSLSSDPMFISDLEKSQIAEYARQMALIDERNEGFNDGKEIGFSEERNERNIEIAKSLLQEKVDINVISKTTGLTLEEINNLK